jgi:hypothetical protein
VSPVRYKLGLYIPEDDILHSHRRENLKSYSLQLFSPTLSSVPASLAVEIRLTICPKGRAQVFSLALRDSAVTRCYIVAAGFSF